MIHLRRRVGTPTDFVSRRRQQPIVDIGAVNRAQHLPMPCIPLRRTDGILRKREAGLLCMCLAGRRKCDDEVPVGK